MWFQLAASVLRHSEAAVGAAVTMLLSPHPKARNSAVTILLGGKVGNIAQVTNIIKFLFGILIYQAINLFLWSNFV